MQELCIVNASTLLRDAEVEACIAPLQAQVDEDLLPHWQAAGAHPVIITFRQMHEIPHIPPDVWPVFLNRNSREPGALAWHTQEGALVYGRVFVGDCLAMGLSWHCTLSHEVLEAVVNPSASRIWRMPDGRYASLEVCDAVEADAFGYQKLGMHVSDFVLPSYFSRRKPGPYDFCVHLDERCPALTEGGYMSLSKPGDPDSWVNVYAEKKDGRMGRRAIQAGYRRNMVAAQVHYQEFSIEEAPTK